MRHAPEYLMEALGLGLFMLSAALFGTLLRMAIAKPFLRRALMGVAMGLTAIALIYSPWGQRSGAHLNPAVTLTFWLLGRVASQDVLGYVTAQFAGGVAGLFAARLLLGRLLAAPGVDFVATRPGAYGSGVAFLAEAAISFGLMLAILSSMGSTRWAGWTGYVAGALIALYIVVEAPLSGMSMNPARTFASALSAGGWGSYWVYAVAPTLGMLLAAESYRHLCGSALVHGAKLCGAMGP
jgi:aquaporin Z